MAIAVLATAGCRSALPAQAGSRDGPELGVLWSARPPGANEGFTVVMVEDVPFHQIPRRPLEAAGGPAPVLPILGGAIQIEVQEGLAGDELVIVGPPSSFLAATSNPSDARDLIAAKTDVTVRLPLARGSSAAAMLEVAGDTLSARMRKPLGRVGARVAPGAPVVLSVDVVWPSGAAEPTVTATLSRAGLPERTTTPDGVRLDIPLD